MAIVTAGTDLAKNVFAVHGLRYPLYRLLPVRCGLGRDSVELHRRGAAPQLPQAKVLAREALEIREPLQRIARDEELALEVARRLLDA